jgi:hypothetical protein
MISDDGVVWFGVACAQYRGARLCCYLDMIVMSELPDVVIVCAIAIAVKLDERYRCWFWIISGSLPGRRSSPRISPAGKFVVWTFP